MRLAVIADVHANRPALEAVLEAVERLAPDRVLCLGDLVGYNAEPSECIARVRAAADAVVAGNHDVDVLTQQPLEGTAAEARLVQAWTRARLSTEDAAYLGGLPNKLTDPAYVAVHGCYLNPSHVNGYVTSTMLQKNLEVVAADPDYPVVALCGHTHTPMCGWLLLDECVEPRRQDHAVWPAKARAVLLNPGSVGQPRDGDPRASFALVDLEARSFEVTRVPYDIEAAVDAIRRAELPPGLGERLREGR